MGAQKHSCPHFGRTNHPLDMCQAHNDRYSVQVYPHKLSAFQWLGCGPENNILCMKKGAGVLVGLDVADTLKAAQYYV